MHQAWVYLITTYEQPAQGKGAEGLEGERFSLGLLSWDQVRVLSHWPISGLCKVS